MNYDRKELVDWIRGIYQNLDNADKQDALRFFPELRESEDEIHRKWILEYLYDGLRKADEQFKGHFKSAIDWLENQQEQSEVDLEKASRNVYESWMGGTMDDVRRDMAELGKALYAGKEKDK